VSDEVAVTAGPRELLRRLAASDERSLTTVMAPTPERDPKPQLAPSLDRRTRELVRLGALLAVGASPTALRWAVELAASNGVDDQAVLDALLAAAIATGTAQVVSSAPRLGLALGFDFELERSDET
jgi:alkylhydroperoxidase/carboxymuconolactone decarboxylase family protein YurZ